MTGNENKDIELKNPLVLDVRERLEKGVNQFENPKKFQEWLKENFGYEKYPYDGRHKYGLDSSTEVSDITYEMLEEGMELFCYMKPKGHNKMNWFPIRIIHKFHFMVFYECLIDGYISFVDCGACDYDWRKYHEKFEPCLPIHFFAPIQIILPKYAEFSENCCFPRNIVNVIEV